MSSVVIVLYIAISAITSCLVTMALMRSRGVRGLRALARDLLDLQADYSAMAKRLKKMQTSSAGEASADKKKQASQTTIDFIDEQRLHGSASENVQGQ